MSYSLSTAHTLSVPSSSSSSSSSSVWRYIVLLITVLSSCCTDALHLSESDKERLLHNHHASTPRSQNQVLPHVATAIDLKARHYRTFQPLFRRAPRHNFTTASHHYHHAYSTPSLHDADGHYHLQAVNHSHYGIFPDPSSPSTHFFHVNGVVTSPLTGCAGLDFFVTATIGGQTFLMIVDSGSTTNAVAGANCQGCNVSPTYTPSSQATNTGRSASNSYGDGSGWTGIIYNDNFAVQGTQSVKINFVSINVATNDFFSDRNCHGSTPRAGVVGTQAINQGLLGLGYPSLAISGTDAWFDSWWNTFGSKQSNTGFMYATQLCQTTGSLWIGGYDATAASGAFQYVPVIDQSYFQVGLMDFGLNGQSLGVTSFPGNAIVDTGTSQITMPTTVFQRFATAVASTAAFKQYFPSASASFFSSVQCMQAIDGATEQDLNNNLPKLYVTLSAGGGSSVQLQLNPVSSYLQLWNYNGNSYLCSGVSSNGNNNDPAIIGYPLLNQFTTVFDRSNNQVGFAPAAGCGSAGFSVFHQGSGASGSISNVTIAAIVIPALIGGIVFLAILYYCIRGRRRSSGEMASQTYSTTATSVASTAPFIPTGRVVAATGTPTSRHQGYFLNKDTNGSPSNAADNNPYFATNSPSSGSPLNEYQQYVSSQGVPYWYNRRTGQSTWVNPYLR